METWDAIRARRNVREYTDRALGGDNRPRRKQPDDDRPLRPLVKPDRRPVDDVVHWGRW